MRQNPHVRICGGPGSATTLVYPTDLMTEVAAGTPTTGVAPRAVLGGHPDDAPADRVHAPCAARSATVAAVVCPRDQLSMPAEEGIGRDQGCAGHGVPVARGAWPVRPGAGAGRR